MSHEEQRMRLSKIDSNIELTASSWLVRSTRRWRHLAAASLFRSRLTRRRSSSSGVICQHGACAMATQNIIHSHAAVYTTVHLYIKCDWLIDWLFNGTSTQHDCAPYQMGVIKCEDSFGSVAAIKWNKLETFFATLMWRHVDVTR